MVANVCLTVPHLNWGLQRTLVQTIRVLFRAQRFADAVHLELTGVAALLRNARMLLDHVEAFPLGWGLQSLGRVTPTASQEGYLVLVEQNVWGLRVRYLRHALRARHLSRLGSVKIAFSVRGEEGPLRGLVLRV